MAAKPKAHAPHAPNHWRPRYADGQWVSPEDQVQTLGGTRARLLWCNLVQDVPPAWTAVLDGQGTVPLSSLSLIERKPA